MKQQLFHADEYPEAADFARTGEHLVEAAGNLAGDLGGYPHHYAAVTVTEAAATKITINPGRIYFNGSLYDLDDAFELDLVARLPLVVGDTVWCAILLSGITAVDQAQRQVLVDADTGETDVQYIDNVRRFTITAAEQAGIPGPTPLKPTVAENRCIVAWVLLSATGIETIEMHQPHRVKSLYQVEGRLTIVEGQIVELVESTKSLRTDLSAVAAAQRDAVRPDVFGLVQRDVAAVRRSLRLLEQEPRSYFFDPALTTDKWDTQHSEWNSRIKEGIRFPFASYKDTQLALYDAANPDITITDGLLLPKWSEVVKLSVTGGTGSIIISQLQHTVVNAIRREISRSSVSYGPIQTVCENQKDWATVGESARVGSTLAVAGETFQVVGLATNKQSADWNANPASVGHKNYDVQSVSVSSWTEVYWDYVTEIVGLNGSTFGQTWLNAQAAIMTGLKLRFTSVGSDGDVHVVVCETTDGGQPDFSKVLQKSTVPRAGLAIGKVRFGFRPMLLEPGKRYSFFVVTTGNHAVATVSGNKYAQGSSWRMSDGVWAQVNLEDDLEFEILGAEFARTRTVVEMQPLTMENGITWFRLLASGWAPAGTSSIWEFQVQGESVWRPLTAENASVLYGLPPLIRLRLVMLGTTDLAPAIVMDAKARAETGRTGGAQVARTKAIALGLSTTSLTVDLVIDQWKAAEHTAALKLISGGVTYTPTASSVVTDADNPKKRRLTGNFTVPATSSVTVKIEGTKTGVDEWFGENLFLMAN